MLEITRQVKVIVVTPAGRQAYLEMLIPQVLGLRPLVDEYHLWVNTNVPEDIAYMESVAKQYPKFIKLFRLPKEVNTPSNGTIYHFWRNCIDPDALYVRFDDDIILLDTPEAFAKFVDFRLRNPQYFLVYGNILNNCLITNIHQRSGRVPVFMNRPAEYACTGDNGWKDPVVAEHYHRHILDKGIEHHRMGHIWRLFDFERVSINCISWLGSTFLEFNGEIGSDEEQWVASDKPKQSNRPNCIFGDFVCVHYAFHTQREHLNTTDILQKYKDLLAEKSNDRAGRLPGGNASVGR
jgi:hypothetical protein